MIKEVIVVEGRDDEIAVKAAVDAEIIITHGFGIKENTFKRIELASERKGVIIFTDPDHAGETIRKRIDQRIPGCKHAFLPREEATKNGDIGIENASAESIIEALSKVRSKSEEKRNEFKQIDLIRNDLIGSNQASERRDKIGKILGIGYANAKQFLSRLNNYAITRDEFEEALKKL
ncbi:ribonuclease M5 [Inediibacterium massiliense]|uniref:ribonuclease M5 n=1 Tax=Inediibacterium massiliense TaxID=1658111 RepID=UPI0006B42B3A|nr:ribonuclease M5 [Inediibacterium massiliense]